MTDRFHVITGGPGSGKTSLITALAADGFRHMPEAGRAIIQDQVDIEGTALPWRDREAFAALMLAWEMRSYREALAGSVSVLFDRGVPDVIGYLRLCGLPVPPSVIRAAKQRRYATKVFIAPPTLARDLRTGRRKEAEQYHKAEATYHAMVEAYTSLGYELVPLPLAPISERARFVQARIGS